MSALGSLVVKLALNHAEFTQGLSKTDQSALKFARNSQRNFDRAERAAKKAFKGVAQGAAGLVASLVGVNASLNKVKGLIDFQDQLGKLSQKTGLAVESLAGLDFAATQSGTNLDRAAKGVRGFARIIADSSGAPNKFTEILGAMGLQIDALQSKNPEEQFLAFADAVQELGEQDRAVAVTSLLGDRMADLVPLLSGGSERLRNLIAEGQRYNPVTAESAARAEVFNDNVDRLGRTFDRLAVNVGTNVVPALNRITVAMLQAHEKSGFLAAGFAVIGQSAKEAFKGIFGSSEADNFATSDIGRLLNGKTSVDELKNAVGGLGDESEKAAVKNKIFAQTFAEIDKSGRGLTKVLTAEEREAESLQKDIKRLTASYDPLIERNERLARLVVKLNAGLDRGIFDQAATDAINKYTDAISGTEEKVESLQVTTRTVTNEMDQLWIQAGRNIQSTLADSIFNFFDDGLKGMVKNIGRTLGRIASQIAAAKLGQALGLGSIFGGGTGGSFGFGGSGGSSGSTLGSVFGAGNLVSAGNSIYQGFTGGLASNAGSLFGTLGETFGSQAAIEFGAGLAGTATSTGVGVFGNAGGAGTAFIGGEGTAIGGAGLSTAGTAGTSAASAGTAATGVGLLLLATQVGNALLANDNKIAGQNSDDLNKIGAGVDSLKTFFSGDFAGGGLNLLGAASNFGTGLTQTKLLEKIPGIGGLVESFITPFIPDVGSFITKIFGRGAPKLKETNLIGQATAEGFEGVTSSKFKAKGGLLRSNKTSRVIIDADSLELAEGSSTKFANFAEGLKPSIELLNFTLDGAISLINQNVNETSKQLGLNSTAGFSTGINIASEKGEFFTGEQITKELGRIEEEFVRHVIPAIDDFAKQGETVVQTFQRLGQQFDVLNTLGTVMGHTYEVAGNFLRETTLQQRANFVEQAGGLDVLQGKIQFVFDNILTEADRFRIKSEELKRELADFGLETVSTENLREILTRNGQAENVIQAGLRLAPLITQVEELGLAAEEAAKASALSVKPILPVIDFKAAANDAFGVLSNAINLRQSELSKEISGVSSVINELSSVTRQLQGAVNTIQPIGKRQARELIKQAANDSDFNNPRLGLAISALTKSSTDGFTSRLDFLQDQAKSSNALRDLEDAANEQLSIEEKTLSVLETESNQLGGILSNAQQQLDALNGIKAALSVGQAQQAFQTSVFNAGTPLSLGAASASSGSSASKAPRATVSPISDAEIRAFANRENVTSFDLYNAAKSAGVSVNRAVSVLGLDPGNVSSFLKENNLPRFASGSSFVPRTGPAIVHQGERIINPQQNKDLIDILGRILVAIESGDKPSKDTYDLFKSMTDDGLSLKTQAA